MLKFHDARQLAGYRKKQQQICPTHCQWHYISTYIRCFSECTHVFLDISLLPFYTPRIVGYGNEPTHFIHIRDALL